jgi:hypothetical protein
MAILMLASANLAFIKHCHLRGFRVRESNGMADPKHPGGA